MRRETTGLVLAVGGMAGAYYLTRELLKARESQARAEGQLALAEPLPTRGLSSGVRRAFDPIFARYGHGLPVAYLRALAKRESNLNPREADDPAWGLLQVIEVVRNDHNKRHGTSYSRRDLLDPVVNTTIATDTLRRIVTSYGANHPRVANMQEDWTNRRFVELVTFGWNAGYSQAAGVGRVAGFLEALAITDITIDTIHKHAAAAGASKHLRYPAKVRWSKSVAALYMRERARDVRELVS